MLICLPLSLREAVSDASFSLLLPVTILSALTAFAAASTGINKYWAVFILFICGPLIIFIRISEVGGSLLATIRESFIIVSNINLSSQGATDASFDFTSWLKAGNLLIGQINGFGHRLLIWVTGSAQNKAPWDLAARAFMWSLSLWIIAAWASWQIRRNGKTLEGLTPATILLGLILYNIEPRSGILWLYVTALIFILGITNIENLIIPWKKQGTDFAESIWEDSIFATLILVIGLVAVAYVVSSFSLKEFLDQMKERPTTITRVFDKIRISGRDIYSEPSLSTSKSYDPGRTHSIARCCYVDQHR